MRVPAMLLRVNVFDWEITNAGEGPSAGTADMKYALWNSASDAPDDAHVDNNIEVNHNPGAGTSHSFLWDETAGGGVDDPNADDYCCGAIRIDVNNDIAESDEDNNRKNDNKIEGAVRAGKWTNLHIVVNNDLSTTQHVTSTVVGLPAGWVAILNGVPGNGPFNFKPSPGDSDVYSIEVSPESSASLFLHVRAPSSLTSFPVFSVESTAPPATTGEIGIGPQSTLVVTGPISQFDPDGCGSVLLLGGLDGTGNFGPE